MSNDTIRVLNVIAEDRIGGPQVRIVRIAKALEQRAIETIVAIPEGDGGFSGMLSEAGIPCRQVRNLCRPRGTWNPAPNLRWVTYLWPAVRQLVRIIERDDISIVHQNDATHIQGAIAGKLARRKVVWHINGMTPVDSAFKLLVALLADVVVASSDAIGKAYMGKGILARDFQVLYPPVDMGDYLDLQGSRIREEFALPDSCPLVTMVGNVNPRKGHLYFVRAASIVKESVPSARFLIVGQHLENRKAYSERVVGEIRRLGLEAEVIFTGFRRDIPEILSASDVVVSPSLAESFGMVVAEAQAAAKPVVAAEVGGVKEIVLSGETGLLVPPKDPVSLAEGVVRLLKDPDTATRMGLRGKERVGRLYSLEECSDRYQVLYHSLMDAAALQVR